MAVISSKLELHILQSLAFSGLAVLEKTIMLHLRRDLWSVGHESDLHWAPVERFLAGLSPRVELYEVRFEGRGNAWARVAARSPDQLAARLQCIVGLSVLELRPYQAEERVAEPVGRGAAPAPEIPSWPCAARTAALEELGERDKYANAAQTRSG